MILEPELQPLTKRQRTILVIAALVCALTRLLAVARSLWDWDEALFVLGMRDYDVTLHHPHPPGFPVYVGMGRLAALLIGDDFRALQAVNLIAAFLLFPAIYLFAREIGFRFHTSLLAGLLFAFFPNVWFFGGGAFSDVPSIVLVLFAVTFMLRGRSSRRDYLVGTVLLALSIGIRPQNLLVGLVPGLMATRRRRPLEIAAALLIGAVIVTAAFGAAIHATGPLDEYLRVVREHADYISRIDSWRSPARTPMWRLFDRFFFKQYQSPLLSVAISLFVLGSVAGSIRERSRSMLINVLTFGPFALFAWMMLDRFSISRFSIGYQPMFALLAADGMRRFGEWLSGRVRRPAFADPLRNAAVVAAVFLAGFTAYSWPALRIARTETAPSLVAAQAVTQHVDPARDEFYVAHTMTMFVDLAHPGLPYTRVIDDRAMPLGDPAGRKAWLLAEITETAPEGFLFTRERTTLWNIARRHYFEIKLQPLTARPQFVSGWHEPERSGIDQWRWMADRSVTVLPPGKGRTMLRMHLALHDEVLAQNPEITVRLNGKHVDRFRPTEGVFDRDYRVQAAPGSQPNRLELFIDKSIIRPENGLPLGLRMRYLTWGPA